MLKIKYISLLLRRSFSAPDRKRGAEPSDFTCSARQPKKGTLSFISVQRTLYPVLCRTAYKHRNFIIKLFSGSFRDCTGKLGKSYKNN